MAVAPGTIPLPPPPADWMADLTEAGRLAWRALPDGPVREAYEALDARVRGTARTLREARSAVNYLFHFVCVFHAPAGRGLPAGADPRALSGTAPDVARAEAAWAELRRRAAWGPKHVREVRTHLSRALLLVAQPLAQAVNPGMYRGACGLTRFRVRRSQHADFTMHDCLPWRVRRAGAAAGRVPYALLCRIGDAMSACLVSVSKAHLQGILVLFDHLLHDPPGLWPPDCEDTVDERWAFLRSLSGAAWLRRYGAVFRAVAGGGRGDGEPDRRIGFDLLKRHVRYISQFHGRVLHPDTRRYIPVPAGTAVRTSAAAAACRFWCAPGGADDDPDADGGATTSSFGSSAGLSEDDEAVGGERRELLDLLAELRERCCHEPPAGAAAAGLAERVYAFRPAEVRRMVDGACTTQEQLLLMLLLTTGLRLGGVARLRLPAAAAVHTAADVPSELVTCEKSQRVRRIHPTRCVRVLLARWFTHGRRAAAGPEDAPVYVFPSPVVRGAPVSTHHLWQVCRGLFGRVGLSGAHVHPHTFRHTVVHLLYMTGSSFEAIAKWIGHASPATTSGVYGRLALRDVEAGLAPVAFLAREGADDEAQAWHSLARFLEAPYHFVEEEGAADRRSAGAAALSSPRPTKAMRRELLGRAAAVSAADVVGRVGSTMQQHMELLREVKRRMDERPGPPLPPPVVEDGL